MSTPLLDTYQALLALAERQRAALEAEAIADYLTLTEEREQLFETLQAQESEAATLSAEDRSVVRAIIPRILDNDEALERLISQLSAAARDEITQLQTGLNALHTYIQQPENREAFFIDRNS